MIVPTLCFVMLIDVLSNRFYWHRAVTVEAHVIFFMLFLKTTLKQQQMLFSETGGRCRGRGLFTYKPEDKFHFRVICIETGRYFSLPVSM